MVPSILDSFKMFRRTMPSKETSCNDTSLFLSNSICIWSMSFVGLGNNENEILCSELVNLISDIVFCIDHVTVLKCLLE